MAASGSVQVPRVLHFQLIDGMQLQINVSGCSNKRNARVEFQLKNCTRTWILHWGFLYLGNRNWYIPSGEDSSGAKTYKQGALQTPFVKNGDIYVVTIELRDPKIHAIEFLLKDGSQDRWLKLNHGNFRVEVPEYDASNPLPSIPKELIDRKAYLIWESRGRPQSSPEQQKQDYADALTELQNQLRKGISLNELQSSYMNARTKIKAQDDWLQRQSKGPNETKAGQSSLALMDLVEKSAGGNNVVSKQNYIVGIYEIVVLSKVLSGDYHIFVALNVRGTAILHWGVSKSSAGEWLAPPSDMLPEKSKMVVGACQTYFTEKTVGGRPFQKRNFVGIQFVIWCGGSWIKNNGGNFFVALQRVLPIRKVNGYSNGIVKWLLDEISQREKEAERSLMHRFNIATELTERCKAEGELGLVGILVWMRLMRCRHLTWNKNYNVKPREISEAQDRFTNLLQRIYLNQPNDREIVRLIVSFVGRGGQGDVGQRIRDEILMVQRNNDCKGGMMEEWHQKLHNNSSPDDVVICEALLNYLRAGFKLDVYWKTLHAHGLTKEKLASYDRPIVSEPCFRMEAKEGLIRDLTMYLKTLKSSEYLRIEQPWKGDLKILTLQTRHLCLSTVKNEDLIYCTKDWYRASESHKSGDAQWALQTKAILDRLQIILSDRAVDLQIKIQPSAEYLGKLLGIGKTTELIRAGSAAVLSMLITRFDPVLRKVANLGCNPKIEAISKKLSDVYTTELTSKMKSARMPWPDKGGDDQWNRAWQAIKKVWASKWNERAYISCKKAKLNHEDLRMAVLIQEVICGDYAFVIHTKNPLSGDTSEIYAEIVKGLGETLVGAYPGRAMSFIAKKNNLKSPIVTCYASKKIGLYCKPTIIFRSNSNGEDLGGYAGAGLYDSVLMDEEESMVLDYSNDPMMVNKAFQTSILSKVAEAGKIIETLYGCPQDIEGVVKDGMIYVVQARPQV
ncbi:hypothetical protein GOBAR_DD25186 [Gossypium barbadense]|nr:hypothetical protein GOBAR_DD25186 [Gossypium barbadense]